MNQHLFFIQYSEQLPFDYFRLAKFFSFKGITIVPIRPGDLFDLLDREKAYAINLCTNLSTREHFKAFRQQALHFLMHHRRLVLFDISSFDKIDQAYRLESHKTYFHLPLPDKIEGIVRRVCSTYFNNRRMNDRWPGGRRAKLPSI